MSYLHSWLFLTAISDVHNGSGQGEGDVDNAIIRQRQTGIPYLQGSSIKGTLRAAWLNNDVKMLFGPESDASGNDENEGAIVFGDAIPLAIPIRALKGGFVWVTCANVLAKLTQYASITGANSLKSHLDNLLIEIKQHMGSTTVFRPKYDPDTFANNYLIQGKLLLEEYEFKAFHRSGYLRQVAEEFSRIVFNDVSWLKDRLSEAFLVLPNEYYEYFCLNAMPIEANIKIDDTGVTTTGSLRYTEYTTSDTIFISLLTFDKDKSKGGSKESIDIKNLFADRIANDLRFIQIGGQQTIGKGRVELKLNDFSENRGG